MNKPKVLVILGPTASGKSDLAVQLGKAFDGEVISADSRQVYKNLDIGTGKISQNEMQGIPHHLLDVAEVSHRFTVAEWKTLAENSIQEILSRNKLPIICGGTGFYISALTEGIEFPEIDIDEDLQKELEKKTSEELFDELSKLDPTRASFIDSKNKRRVARAIMIARQLGKVPPMKNKPVPYQFLKIGISIPDAELKERIKRRLLSRMDSGMIEEAQELYSNGLSFERMNELGLEYRYLAEFLQGNLTKAKFVDTLTAKIWQYARRQKTWFKRDNAIKWHSLSELEQIKNEVKTFLSNQALA